MGTIFLFGGQLFFDFITKKQGLCGHTYVSGQAPLLTIFLLGGQLFFDFITKKQGLCGYTYASGQAPLLAA